MVPFAKVHAASVGETLAPRYLRVDGLMRTDPSTTDSPTLCSHETRSWSLAGRLTALACLLLLEVLSFTVAFDTSNISRAGLTGLIRHWGAPLLRAATTFVTLFALLVYRILPSIAADLSPRLPTGSVSIPLLGAHAALVAALYALSRQFFGWVNPSMPPTLLASLWLLTGLFSVGVAAAAFVPIQLIPRLAANTLPAWIPASVGAFVTYYCGPLTQSLWTSTQTTTFRLVLAMVRPFTHDIVVQPGIAVIGSHRFSVAIEEACSGLEGVGLILVFCAVWLWLTRKEHRFPQALVIVPVGAGLIFLLNAVRIAVLFLIGYAGAGSVAMGGYHSQAGWMLFNLTAIGLMLSVGRISWIAAEPARLERKLAAPQDPTLWYLAPFLGILSAAMISKAASGEFEWAYPLRFIAGAAILFGCRRHYREMTWRIGWAGAVAGLMVFALWMGWELLHPGESGSVIHLGLATMPSTLRAGWIVSRVLGATLTVPLAEELAFRGYLMRRLASENFAQVSFTSIGAVPILISSAAFGAFHGSRWLIGTIAGVLYATALRHRGRMGDAVAAHAITNALLSLEVLLAGRWNLW